MPRIRTIKPEFPQSESMGRVSRDARLLFIQLWTIADDFGRLRGNSRMLASLLYPYDDDAKDLIDGWLSELETEHCIQTYVIDGATYVQIQKWQDHQKVDKPTASRLPEYSREFAKPRENSPRTMDLGPGPRTVDLDQDLGSGPIAKPATPARVPPEIRETKTARIWDSYSTAYRERYGAEPIRNAKVSAQLANIVDRIGAEEAPHVAAWFVTHSKRWYVDKGHSVECLQKDCEQLRTEWATGRRSTSTAALQADRTQTTADVFGKLIQEAEEAQRAN